MRRWLLAVAAGTYAGCSCQPPDDGGFAREPAAQLDDPACTKASEPAVCVGEQGEVHVLWVGTCLGEPAVRANVSLDGGATWLAQPVRVSQNGPADVSELTVACDGSTVVAAWSDARDSEVLDTNIYASSSPAADAAWPSEDALLEVDPDSGTESLEPEVAMSGDNVYVCWQDFADPSSEILCSASRDGGASWTAGPARVDRVTDELGTAGSVTVAAATGVAVVAWEDWRAGETDIWSTRSTDGGVTFGEGLRVDDGDEAGRSSSHAPRLVAAGDAMWLAWDDSRSGMRDVFVRHTEDGGLGWASEARADQDAPGSANSGNVAVVASGAAAWVAWSDARGEASQVFVRRFDGAAPSEPEQRADPSALETFWPVVAAHDGDFAVGWIAGAALDPSRPRQVLYRSGHAHGVADGPLRIDGPASAGTSQGQLRLAVHHGVLYAVWVETDEEDGSHVWFKRLRLGEQTQRTSRARRGAW